MQITRSDKQAEKRTCWTKIFFSLRTQKWMEGMIVLVTLLLPAQANECEKNLFFFSLCVSYSRSSHAYMHKK
jgi:hypothetical protein